jgi:hypothetical protein
LLAMHSLNHYWFSVTNAQKLFKISKVFTQKRQVAILRGFCHES